jgi:hypothetical protein
VLHRVGQRVRVVDVKLGAELRQQERERQEAHELQRSLSSLESHVNPG